MRPSQPPKRHSTTPSRNAILQASSTASPRSPILYRQQGNLEGALHAFHEGLEWVCRLDYAPLVEAEIQKDLGHFYAQIGDWDQAVQALERCLELEGKQNDPVSLEARQARQLIPDINCE